MNPGEWIALATLCLAVIGAAIHIGRKIGSLPGMIAEAVRNHEKGCTGYEAKELTQPQIVVPMTAKKDCVP